MRGRVSPVGHHNLRSPKWKCRGTVSRPRGTALLTLTQRKEMAGVAESQTRRVKVSGTLDERWMSGAIGATKRDGFALSGTATSSH